MEGKEIEKSHNNWRLQRTLSPSDSFILSELCARLQKVILPLGVTPVNCFFGLISVNALLVATSNLIAMIVVVVHCTRSSSRCKAYQLRLHIRKLKPDNMFRSEMKIKSARVVTTLGFSHSQLIDAQKSEGFFALHRDMEHYCCTQRLRSQQKTWLFRGIYGRPRQTSARYFWRDINNEVKVFGRPSLIIRYF